MSRFYPSFNYEYVLDLPLKVFTLYNTNLNRIRAEEELRLFAVFCGANNADSAKSVIRRLEKELGNPMIAEPAMDPHAIEKLKALSERLNGNR